jgi:putative redox protein
MSFTASARRIDDTLRHEVDVNGRHTIITDEPTSLGGTDTGPAPHELYDHDSVPRHFDVVVDLPDGLAPEQVERLRHVADSCPVRRAMEAGFTFDEQIRTAPNPTAASSA